MQPRKRILLYTNREYDYVFSDPVKGMKIIEKQTPHIQKRYDTSLELLAKSDLRIHAAWKPHQFIRALQEAPIKAILFYKLIDTKEIIKQGNENSALTFLQRGNTKPIDHLIDSAIGYDTDIPKVIFKPGEFRNTAFNETMHTKYKGISEMLEMQYAGNLGVHVVPIVSFDEILKQGWSWFEQF